MYIRGEAFTVVQQAMLFLQDSAVYYKSFLGTGRRD